MKKKSLTLVIMRITLVYATIIFSLGTSFASNVNAQVSLDKEITLNVANNEFGDVLNAIQKLSGVKFAYSSAIIQPNRKITLSANNRTVGSILNEILPQLNLTYDASGTSVIITRTAVKSTGSTSAIAETIAGKVTDEKGETLIGVNVNEKGTRNQAVTDINGNYRITVAGPASVLVFTYVGQNPVEQTVGNRTTVNVTMTAQATALTDVVVTALGIKRESKKLGYSATTANTEELSATNRTTNVMGSLEGKVAGLVISPPSMGPGASTRIRLRGQSAFAGANTSPLLVLNGLPLDQNAQSANGGNAVDFGDALTQINQDDIESMTILKGSTAAALYGSRASNGAIIITTKTGAKNQKFGVEYTSNFAADKILDYTRYQTVYGYGNPGSWDPIAHTFKRPLTVGDAVQGGVNSWGVPYDGVPTIQFDGVLRPYSPIANRMSQFYRTGLSWTNSLAFSGGNTTTSYRMSFSNQDAKGVYPNNDYHRKVFNFGLNSKVTDKLTLTFNANYANEQNNNPPQGGQQGGSGASGAANFLNRINLSIPLDVLRDNAVDPVTGSERVTSGLQGTVLNPYYSLNSQFNRRNTDRILSTISARYDFFKWLYLQGRANVEMSDTFSESNTPHGVGSSSLYNSDGSAFNGNYNVSTNKATNTNYDFLLGTNNQKIGDFTAELTLGGNTRYDRSSNFTEGGTNFSIQNLYAIGNTVTKTLGYGIDRRKVNSVYGVADFGYKSFLYLSVTDRVDWFSTLTPPSFLVANPKNSYNYPSVSGSFVFSELLPNLSWLSYGKIRASFAATANAGPIGAFAGQLNYNLGANPYTAANGQSYVLGNISNGNIPNPLIVPYGVSEKELGLELKTLNNRLNFDVTAYSKTTKDQIINVTLSNATGYGGTPQNLASLRNRGLEFLVDGTPIKTRNFSWNSSINAAYNESTVTDLGPGTQKLVATDFGNSGNEFLGKLVYEKGMALNQLEAKTYRRDANGNYVVNPDGTLVGSANDVIFGSADPKWTGGWTNNFRYKKLTLSVFIDYKFGGKVFSSTALNGARQGLTQYSLAGRSGVTWPGVLLVNGVVTTTPNTAVTNPQTFYTSYRGQQIADPFVFKSDFIKLRNISIAYDFSSLVKEVKYIKGLSLSAFVRNAAIIKKYIPDVDPEAFASSSDSRLGYEQSTIPTTRTFGLNLSVKF